MAFRFKLLYCPILWIILLLGQSNAQAQFKEIAPGFDPKECDDLLRLNFVFLDTTGNTAFENFQKGYTFVYRSPSLGLDNTWDLWTRADSTVVILLRGTTSDMKSILADFYSVMMPAQGKIRLTKDKVFAYKLASSNRAAVHAGFLIGFAFLADDMKAKIDSLYGLGYTNYLIAGHSQGGALAYYVSAWLHHQREDNIYPGIKVKTYASASPKMGNMYFAYDYDNMTREGWSYSIVNSDDAVPEMPFTTQQVDIDMNEPNPILGMMKRFDSLPFFKRIIIKGAFNKMIKNAANSSKSYQKYLGRYLHDFVQDALPELETPEAVKTSYYSRPGVPISLLVNDRYLKRFMVNDVPYYHHGIIPYRFLLREYYGGLEPMQDDDVAYLLKGVYD